LEWQDLIAIGVNGEGYREILGIREEYQPTSDPDQ
jgi:transposase-like protein